MGSKAAPKLVCLRWLDELITDRCKEYDVYERAWYFWDYWRLFGVRSVPPEEWGWSERAEDFGVPPDDHPLSVAIQVQRTHRMRHGSGQCHHEKDDPKTWGEWNSSAIPLIPRISSRI